MKKPEILIFDDTFEDGTFVPSKEDEETVNNDEDEEILINCVLH